MNRLVLILVGIAAIFSALTYFLGKLLPRIRSLKYFPALICLLASLYYLYLAKTIHSGTGFKDLAYVVMAMMFFIAFVSGLVTGLILDFSSKFKS